MHKCFPEDSQPDVCGCEDNASVSEPQFIHLSQPSALVTVSTVLSAQMYPSCTHARAFAFMHAPRHACFAESNASCV